MVLNSDSLIRSLGRIHREPTVPVDLTHSSQLADGVSVIVPAYKSRAYLPALLNSLAHQSLPSERFEVIVVLNGPDDGSAELLAAEDRFNLRWYRNSIAGAGAARNLGIRLATRAYSVFLDADDTFEPEYLEQALKLARPQTIVVSPIVDVAPSGALNPQNALNRKISQIDGGEVVDYPWLLSFNVCKLLATPFLQTLRFNEDLRSGEDVVFWASLLAYPHLSVARVSSANSAYRRLLTEQSVSRTNESFDFNVAQRLDVIAAVQRLQLGSGVHDAIASRVGAQASFIRNYIDSHPQDMDQLEEQIAHAGVIRFPWEEIPRPDATQLVFSYCFPPFADTAGVIAAKVVSQRRQYSDVIANDMKTRRRTDHSLDLLASRWVKRASYLPTPTSFGNWDEIAQFAAQACQTAQSWTATSAYESMYSRALWPGSHLAAALFKRRHPELNWVAEFSDPLRTNAEGHTRPGNRADDDVSREIIAGSPELGSENLLFGFIERATFELADRIIVTNPNQLSYMLAHYSQEEAQRYRAKTEIRPHPAPSAALFDAARPSLNFDPSAINIGYFGSVYANRGFSEIFTALGKSDPRVHLHIFTGTFDALETEIESAGLHGRVHAHPYLPYIEFLGACRECDVLLVTDACATESMGINPFLPSKVSDYRASGTPIWAIVEEGSPLDHLGADFTSRLRDSESTQHALNEIIRRQAK